MSACHYLSGENVAPLTAAKVKALIGHRIQYLRESDIDRSGRGYIFPKVGVVVSAFRRYVELDSSDNYQPMSCFAEVIDLGEYV